MELSSQDYEKLFSFYGTVNRDCTNYQNILLFSLATIFNFKLTMYGTFIRGEDGELKSVSLVSNSVEKDLLEVCRLELLKEKALVNGFKKLCYARPSATFILGEELKEAGLLSAKSFPAFKRISTSHVAILGINGSPGRVTDLLFILGPTGSGGFDERERTLFKYIGQAFNDSKLIHQKFLYWQRRMDALGSYFDELPFGFAVLDAKMRLIYSTSVFWTISAKISSSLGKPEIIKDILALIDDTVKIPKDNVFTLEIVVNDTVISLRRERAALSLRTEILYFITLKKDSMMRIADSGPLDISSSYGLTKREGEVAYLAAKGYSNQEISSELYIGISTVKTHISSIFSKLMVSSRSEMIKKLRETL